jgi:cyanophycin synthetase
MSRDFEVGKFAVYSGPNLYLDRKAVVFNLYLEPEGHKASYYGPEVLRRLPKMEGKVPDRVAELFARALVEVMKVDLDLFIDKYSIGRDGEDFVVAVEYVDERVARDAVEFTCGWFRAMNEGRDFDFRSRLLELQETHVRSLYGGPTFYSIYESALKRGIPVNYLREENQFQWGYGKKGIRGRSTIVHTDGIKDTEFTTYKDMVADFLEMCGFPTPKGATCFSEDEIIRGAEELGYPVVVKPVSGHKGQGVVTGIESADEVSKAYRNIVDAAETAGSSFDGAIVQQQIAGNDHRLLAVGGKFAAALERVPAYVDGNSRDDIEELIRRQNETEPRADTPRSPLTKIRIDDDLLDYLGLQDLTLRSVPKEGERVYLRRVANISAGGVSINVTDKIHWKNIKLVEDIAKFFRVTCLGIDVLTEDIGKPWDEGNFGIIEINAGPGVFMHLAPAIGGSIDVPGQIMRTFFPKEGSERIPIVVGNRLSLKFCGLLNERLKALKSDVELGTLTEEGIHFRGEFFHKNPRHDENVKIILRSPNLDFAVLVHTKDDIFEFGVYHEGSDVAVLESPHEVEDKVLTRDLRPGGLRVEVKETEVVVTRNGQVLGTHLISSPEEKDPVLLDALEPFLEDLLNKYE